MTLPTFDFPGGNGLFLVRRKGALCWTCRTGSEKARRHELAIKALLDAHANPALRFYSSHNQSHPCTRALQADTVRPDFVWELPSRVFILEVDEREHRDYNMSCERARLHKLHELAGKPLTLLRFNPDAPLRAFGQVGKRKRGADDMNADDARYAWLMAALVALIVTSGGSGLADTAGDHSGLKAEAAPELEVLVERGNEELRVLYAGYSQARVDELWQDGEAVLREEEAPISTSPP